MHCESLTWICSHQSKGMVSMNMIKNFARKVMNLAGAVSRYPATCIFLLLAAILNTVSIYKGINYEKILFACAMGALFCAVLQMIHERYFAKQGVRILLYLAGCVCILCYYLLLLSKEMSFQIELKSEAALLALLIAYILVPCKKGRVNFNESFMIAFKSFFISVFYAGVLFGGISIILAAIQNLIYPISSDFYGYSATWVFILLAPLFFFSQIPVYSERRELVCSRFLEILISYIIIPLVEIFTLILIIYIIGNVGDEFWTNNLLEPMLVYYAFAIILISVLSSNLHNKFSSFFRKVFPIVLIPIVILQITSSILGILERGFTHTGYYVLLFGIFAIIAGVVLSLGKSERNGIIAGVFIVLSIISIIPPVDAFTVSKKSQQKILEQVLVNNGMLQDNQIIKVSTISDADKKRIISAVQYLQRMNETKAISWLPADFDVYEDFYDTFGFHEYEDTIDKYRYFTVYLGEQEVIPLTNFVYMTQTYIDSNETMTALICKVTYEGAEYTLEKRKTGDNYELVLSDENKNVLIVFDTKEISDRFESYDVENKEITQEEATFNKGNEKIGLTVVVRNFNMYYNETEKTSYGDIYIFLDFQ